MSALHAVVVGDLRFKKKDRTAYEAWKKAQAEEEALLRRKLTDEATAHELARLGREPMPPNLEADFRRLHWIYWDARVRWASELSRTDPQLFRHLVPCDPVVTVAPDVVFFECFSKDESAYGCLTVDRDALSCQDGGLGTTNVDTPLPSTTTSRPCGATARPACSSTPQASRSRSKAVRTTAKRRSSCPPPGSVASASSRRR
jgi:hypothetical protein